MAELSPISGKLDSYEFYIEIALYFRCADCGASLDCPVGDSDQESPNPPWSTREGRRGVVMGWYVPPITSDGSLQLTCFCPKCTQNKGLKVQESE